MSKEYVYQEGINQFLMILLNNDAPPDTMWWSINRKSTGLGGGQTWI